MATAECEAADNTDHAQKKHATEGVNLNGENGSKSGLNGDNANIPATGRGFPNKKQGQQSFASLFKDNRVPIEASMLTYIVPPVGDVVIDMEEIDSVEKSFGHCLVGYVMGPRPSAFTVLNLVKRWGSNVKFLFKDNGWIKFQFPTELARDTVLHGGPYIIAGRQLFLKVMPSCFLFSQEDMVHLPSWVQIFGLLADCWTAPALSKIASVVGKPIHTDMLTISKKGANYARVLVELDVKKPRVLEYSVQLPTGKKTLVKFKYEFEPKYCSICNSLGHVEDLCGVNGRTKNNLPHPRHWKNTRNHENHASVDDVQLTGKKTAGTDIKAGDAPECSRTNDCTVPIIPEPKQLYSDLVKNNSTQEKQKDLKHPADCSSNMEHTHSVAVSEQQHADSNEMKNSHGKAVADNFPACKEQQQDDFSEDDLLSCDDTDHPRFYEENFNLDSDDLEDILSRVRTKDGAEWKTVSKKNRRFKNKVKFGKQYVKADSGTSSMETEYITLDPITKQPLKGTQSRVFKKNTNEARRPNTASGGQ